MKNKKPITKTELLEKLKVLGNLSKEQKKKIVCSLIGNSSIVDMCFSDIYCARCDEVIGDILRKDYDKSYMVLLGHDCEICNNNAKKLTWEDFFLITGKEINKLKKIANSK